MLASATPRRLASGVTRALAEPTVAIFLSANVVNLGNLAFNILFSRWMGPSAFGQLATLLTIFLAVMAVLAALQLAVSQHIAKGVGVSGFSAGIDRISRRSILACLLILPVLVGAVLVLDLGQSLGLGSPSLLPLLLMCLPFALPLAVARGMATGRLDAPKVILSAQVEMWVRLIGCAAAWQMGFGLEGVTFVIALSVLAGWLPLQPDTAKGAIASPGLLKGLVIVAMPFALLQAAQTILLDGDILLAQALLGPKEAGLVAALTLFQRIQFYGCFSLAVVLLPRVTAAVSEGGSPLRAAAPVIALFLSVSTCVVLAALLVPDLLISLLVGPAFLPAASLIPTVAIAAATFTLSYLLATFLAATGDRLGIWAMALACPVQIGLMAAFGGSMHALVTIKLGCQLALAACLLIRAIRPILMSNRSKAFALGLES